MTQSFLGFFEGNHIFVSKTDGQGLDPTKPTPKPIHLHSSFEEAEEFLRERESFQWGTFFAVNELDKSLDPTKQRTNKMVTRCRAVWLDDDSGGGLRDLKDFPIKPNLIVNSSENKYHYYWLTSTTEFEEWESMMDAIQFRYMGDKGAKDLARVLRLPGFNHHKAEPYMVTHDVIREKPYSWDAIKTAFPPMSDEEKVEAGKKKVKDKDGEDVEYNTDFDMKTVIEEMFTAKDYHHSMVRIALSFANKGLDRESIAAVLRGLMLQAYKREEWGDRIGDEHLYDCVDCALQKVAEEKKDVAEVDHADKFATGRKLPDEIIAPPDTVLGALTRAIHETWWIPNLMIAGMVARHTIAYLAGGNYRSELGDRINIQQVAIGGSGCGKDPLVQSLPKIINEVFQGDDKLLAKLLSGIIDEAGSAEGLDDRMRQLGDKHDLIFVRDEIGELMQQASGGNQHKQGIFSYALKMYTKSDSVSNERVRARKKDDETGEILYAPHFIISGATTPDLIVDGLNSSFIGTGIMARLMFFSADPYKGKRLRRCEELKLDKQVTKNLKAILKTDKMCKGGLYSMPSARIYNPKMVRFEDDVLDYCYDEALYDDDRKGDMVAIWNRRVPNAKKYAMIEAIAEDPDNPVVNMDMMKRALEFVGNSCGYTVRLFSGSVGDSAEDMAAKAILEKMKKAGDKWVKRADMTNIHAVKKLNKFQTKNVIQDLIDSGEIEFHSEPSARGKSKSLYRYTGHL